MQSKDEERKIVMEMLIKFMLKTQSCINFDKAVLVLLENRVQQTLIDELFEQTDAAMKLSAAGQDAAGDSNRPGPDPGEEPKD